MRPLIQKIKPSRGFAHAIYILLNILLPLSVVILVKVSLGWVAFALIILSKWRMFAVRPRFWLANLRTNAIDIIVGLSTLGCMLEALNGWYRLAYAVLWALWLIVLKPRVSTLAVSMQALVGFAVGLMALFAVWPNAPLAVLVVATGLLCYFAAHHFFYSFDEPHTRLLAYVWGYFGAALTWVLGHWLVFYWVIAQPTLLLVSLALLFGTLYYLDHFDRLSVLVRRQIIFIGAAILLIIWGSLVFFHWLHGGSIIV